jgi:hypothetical protein
MNPEIDLEIYNEAEIIPGHEMKHYEIQILN